jgi:predicted AlkP superfamily pyrophosphatase or phosphodiesterase
LKNYDRALAGTIKFHKICHWPAFIQEFGAPTNYNAETFETAHKWFVKRWIPTSRKRKKHDVFDAAEQHIFESRGLKSAEQSKEDHTRKENV